MDLEILDNLKGYTSAFMDPVLWTPYVRSVCQKHNLAPANTVRPGLAGTCPTFVVDERWVVKFFGRLFDGGTSFAVERLCASLAQAYQPFPIPELLAWGELLPDEPWRWPYLIFEFIPGKSLGEVLPQMSQSTRQAIAGWLGEAVRNLHDIPLDSLAQEILPAQDSIKANSRLSGSRRQLEWRKFPQSWIPYLDEFLVATDYLDEDPWPRHLIHADLTRDHILGFMENRSWSTRAVIDFGDALVGSLDYELAVIHLDIFQGNTFLLKTFIKRYGLEQSEYAQFPFRMMRTALLHQFNLFEPFSGVHPVSSFQDFEAVALSLWNITS